MIYYTALSFLYDLFILPVHATHLVFHSSAITHLLPQSLLPGAYQNSSIFRCIFMCVPVISPRLSHAPHFLVRAINKAVTQFICISVTQTSPVPHILTFYPFPFCLASLSHIILVSVLHQCALKRRCNQFPMRLSGSLTGRLPNFIPSTPACPQIFHPFPLHPFTSQPPADDSVPTCPAAIIYQSA